MPNTTTVISFRADPDMVARLAQLGAASENTRANTVWLIVAAALYGAADDTVQILRARVAHEDKK
jgi:hypothetical protein